MPNTTRAAVLAPGQLRHLLRVTEATSRYPERDAAILLIGICCGMRCTETAQITVADLTSSPTRAARMSSNIDFVLLQWLYKAFDTQSQCRYNVETLKAAK